MYHIFLWLICQHALWLKPTSKTLAKPSPVIHQNPCVSCSGPSAALAGYVTASYSAPTTSLRKSKHQRPRRCRLNRRRSRQHSVFTGSHGRIHTAGCRSCTTVWQCGTWTCAWSRRKSIPRLSCPTPIASSLSSNRRCPIALRRTYPPLPSDGVPGNWIFLFQLWIGVDI